MVQPMTKIALSGERRKLVELMQSINFGRIENLVVCGGQPVFAPPPRIVREHKFGGAENGPRPELGAADFKLRSQHVELFALLDQVRDGAIDIQTQHGLPFHATIAGSGA